MFKHPDDDNVGADSDATELESSSTREEPRAKSGGQHIATPMNFAPVAADLSPGKCTFADFMTVADSNEDLDELAYRKATPAAAKAPEISANRKGTPAAPIASKINFSIEPKAICIR